MAIIGAEYEPGCGLAPVKTLQSSIYILFWPFTEYLVNMAITGVTPLLVAVWNGLGAGRKDDDEYVTSPMSWPVSIG